MEGCLGQFYLFVRRKKNKVSALRLSCRPALTCRRTRIEGKSLFQKTSHSVRGCYSLAEMRNEKWKKISQGHTNLEPISCQDTTMWNTTNASRTLVRVVQTPCDCIALHASKRFSLNGVVLDSIQPSPVWHGSLKTLFDMWHRLRKILTSCLVADSKTICTTLSFRRKHQADDARSQCQRTENC